ncbi:MAG: IclR family transcriptional regulator [Actinobacteria bacterium]|nr:IclR family transcriptional regulator [Actinomycetota bacterium]MCB9389299.1 IclR family transcriptional regulator [Acidimicrobiia bacterium]
MSGNRAREQHRTSTSAADVIMASSPAVTASTAVGVLDKAVTLVQVLAGRGPLSIAELAEHSGVARPTVHRLVGSLVAHQVLERTGETVTLGIRLVEWAHSAGAGRTLAAVADAVMREVSAETGESVQLYVRRGETRVCVLVHEPRAGLRDSVPVGAVLPLHAGSGGTVLMAFDPHAPSRTGDDGKWADVVERGWASSLGERASGVASVSAPVLDRSGVLLGALCISGPVERIAPRIDELASAACGAARRVGEQLA